MAPEGTDKSFIWTGIKFWTYSRILLTYDKDVLDHL